MRALAMMWELCAGDEPEKLSPFGSHRKPRRADARRRDMSPHQGESGFTAHHTGMAPKKPLYRRAPF